MKFLSLVLILALSPFAHSQEPLSVPLSVDDPARAVPEPLQSPRPFNLPPSSEQTLGNGIKVVMKEVRRSPLVSFHLLLPFAGSKVDPENRAGVAEFLAALLNEGTRRTDVAELLNQIADTGASFGAGVTKDLLSISFAVKMEDEKRNPTMEFLDKMMGLTAEMVREPALDEKAIERVRGQFLTEIASGKGDPDNVAAKRFNEAAFEGHPYGISKDHDSVAAITRGELAQFHRTQVGPRGAIIAMSGAASPAEMAGMVQKHFGDWSVPEAEMGRINAAISKIPDPKTAVRFPAQTVIEVIDVPSTPEQPVEQSSLMMGHTMLPRNHPDYYASIMLNQILGGGGFAGRLFKKIRVENGWSYGVSSHVRAMKDSGLFSISGRVKIQHTADSVRAILAEIKRIQMEPVSKEDLDIAKVQYSEAFVRAQQRVQAQSGQMSESEFFGLPADELALFRDRIMSVTPAQVQAAAQTYFRAQDLKFVIASDADRVSKELSEFGAVRIVDMDGNPRSPS